MRGFIKTFTILIYFFLALLIQPTNVFACENLNANNFNQYISSSKSEITLINNKKEEYYTIIQNRNRSEITNPSNKNQNLGFNAFDKTADFIISNSFISDNTGYFTRISHNISPKLENAIYTRAP